MNPTPDKFRSLRGLIEKALDGSLSSSEAAELETLIQQDAEQRQYYCQYLHMTIGLLRCCNDRVPATGKAQLDSLLFSTLWNALSQEEQNAPAVTIPQIEIPASKPTPDRSPQASQATPSKHRFTLLTLAAVCLVGFSLMWITGIIQQNMAPQEVATLRQSLNASFAQGGGPTTGARLTQRKSPWHLETGLIDIRFDSGAQVVLEGPATFRLLEDNLMDLQNGRLFATIPPEAQGFTVNTPDSHVVDMGTEFGLMVKTDGTSDLHMIKGKAAFKPLAAHHHAPDQMLNAGQAKRFQTNGKFVDIPLASEAFVRRFNPRTHFVWRGQGLCLADLIGHGNGLHTGRGSAFIDPIAGYQDRLYSTAKGNAFHGLADNTFIDGLFVPDGSTPQIVSSQGHHFEDCPPTNGECYANLSANPDRGIYIYDNVNTLNIRVVDPTAQGTPAFVLSEETYTVTGDEQGIQFMPDLGRTSHRLGTGTWVHFKLGTPVPLHTGQQYGFDVTVSHGNNGFFVETAGVRDNRYRGGSAYSSGLDNGTNSLNLDEVYEGDHTFVVELAPADSALPSQHSLTLRYSREAPELGPDDIACLEEAFLDNQNVGSHVGQTNSLDNDHATYIAQDRRGLGQTFTTGDNDPGYVMTGFWLKHVKYKQNLSQGDGSWWYVRAQHRNGLIRFDEQLYGNPNRPCLVMHANLGITFDLQTLRDQDPTLVPVRFDCQTGIADFGEDELCNMDFWILVDGQVRQAQRQVTTKGQLHEVSIELSPTDRFLTLVTTDGGEPDRSGTLQRSYSGDWGVFTEPIVHFDSL